MNKRLNELFIQNIMKNMDKKWDDYEKNVFLTLLQVYRSVPENNKKLNTGRFEWRSIQKKFIEMTGMKISAEELKNKWEEMKVCAKYHFQFGNVSSSECIKVLAICLGIYEVDGFDMSKVRPELQVEFQPPKLSLDWDESLGNRLLRDSAVSQPSKKRKKKKLENQVRSIEDKRADLLEEEFRLKKLNLERELQHQLIRHKMELEILDLKKKIMLKRLDLLNKNSHLT